MSEDNAQPQTFELKPGMSLDAAEAQFLAVVRDRIQSVAENYDEARVKEEEESLRALHREFFQFSMHWAAAELKKPRSTPDHADAAKQKKNARAQIEALQGQIADFALCYMHINRFTSLLRDEIRRTEGGSADMAGKKIKWTSDAGVMMARYRKQRRKLLADTARLREAHTVLESLDNALNTIQGAIGGVYGADKEEPFMRKIVSALRTGDMNRAAGAVREITETKRKFGIDQKAQEQQAAALATALASAVALVAKNAAALASGEENKLFLRPAEADIAYNGYVQELQQIRAFIVKYQLPYMEYKLDSLHHLRDKLMVLGSLDSLMVLYRRLLAGLVAPMTDIKDVRLYESEVVEKARYLLEGQFQEVPKIYERALETVQEFREGTGDFAEMAAQADPDEVAVPATRDVAAGA